MSVTSSSSSFALRVADLCKSFDGAPALDGVSFDVPRGSVFGLLGPNGAGKTTLFSLAAGFLRADRGAIEILDQSVSRIDELQGRMTILPQDAAFQRNVPIIEQLVFLRLLDGQHRSKAEAEVEEALEKVGIAEYKQRGIHALSHGMLKRLGIAQAFLGEPDLILLDEPTSGLDPQNARQIRDLVLEMQRERGVTTVISSHNLGEIQELCDHVAILDKGKLKAAGSVDAVTRGSHMLELELRRSLTSEEAAAVTAVDGVGRVVDRGPQRYRVEFALAPEQSVDAVGGAILQKLLDCGLMPKSMREGDSLEETFLRLIADGADEPDAG